MLNKLFLKLFLLCMLLLNSEQGWAFKCDGKIIDVGDRQRKVIKYCGQPTSVYKEVDVRIHRGN